MAADTIPTSTQCSLYNSLYNRMEVTPLLEAHTKHLAKYWTPKIILLQQVSIVGLQCKWENCKNMHNAMPFQ